MDKTSYALGMGIGSQLKGMGAEKLNIDDFAQAIKDIVAGKPQMTHSEAQRLSQEFFVEQEKLQRARAAELGKAAREQGEKYLAENAKKDGVITTASGLQYMVLQEGTGKSPKATDSVMCHYEGFLIDGTVFDSSVERGEPATFAVGQVIPGWVEGLQLMREGAAYRLFIPSNLAYGPHGTGPIQPNSTLIFDVQLIKVEKK
jgi:FKBP-type peptidyl-prolyl cis-trans isomerase FklB